MNRTNTIIFQQTGRYGGWPANGGIWIWDEEIVVSFATAAYKPPENGGSGSFIRPQEVLQARTTDGGHHWTLEKPASLVLPDQGGPKPAALQTPLDFHHPDFSMMFKFTSQDVGPSWFYTSFDRCRTWQSPAAFHVPGLDGIAARTDYIVRGRHDCIVFASMAKANGREGRAICARTDNGGLTWKALACIGEEPEGYRIMPSTVALGADRLLTAIRLKDPDKQGCIEIYLSEDAGRSWEFLGEAASNIGAGNPPSLLALKDGRFALIYGYRAVPYGVRARISSDEGNSWGEEIVLRDDGAFIDLGYVKSVQRPDGNIVSVYYFNGPADHDRTVQATIWQP